MGFNQISILGVGLIGGSMGLACRESIKFCKIIGYGHRPEELQRAVERGAIHEATTDAAAAVADADLVVLCTPVGSFGPVFESIAQALKAGVIVTDVGSTKRMIAKLAERILPPNSRFVGSHPMAGSERHGIENARADLFANAVCIVTPTDSTDPKTVEIVEEFWHRLKMKTVRMSPEEHDRLTADISHLPHAIAAALVRMQTPGSLRLAAGGFLDSTRIAAGDSTLWRDILLENRDNLRSGVVRLQDQLQQLLDRLDANDATAVQEWLKAANVVRSGMRKPPDR
jgi:prephenate dehydrogenase